MCSRQASTSTKSLWSTLSPFFCFPQLRSSKTISCTERGLQGKAQSQSKVREPEQPATGPRPCLGLIQLHAFVHVQSSTTCAACRLPAHSQLATWGSLQSVIARLLILRRTVALRLSLNLMRIFHQDFGQVLLVDDALTCRRVFETSGTLSEASSPSKFKIRNHDLRYCLVARVED